MYSWRDWPHKQALMLATPMIAGNISTPLMGLADTAMLGQLGNPAFIGGVAVGANLFALLFWVLSFLRMSVAAGVGFAMGSNTPRQGLAIFTQSMMIAAALALILITLHPLYLGLGVSLISQDPSVHALAVDYTGVRIFSAPAVLANFVIFGWLIGVQNMRAILWVTLMINGVNLVFDYLFILVFFWGAKGAAAASVLGDYSGLALGMIFFWRSLKNNSSTAMLSISYALTHSFGYAIKLLRSHPWRNLFSTNSDLFVRSLALLAVFNFFIAQSGTFGNSVLAANAIMIQLMFLATFAIDGYAYAAETMVANAKGKGDDLLLHQSACATFLVGVLISVLMACGFWLLQDLIIEIMTDTIVVKMALQQSFHWLCLMPLAGVVCYLLDGVFIGAAKTTMLRNWMLACVIGIFLPCWWWLKPMGNDGLWLAFAIFHLARGVSLAILYIILTKKRQWIDDVLAN